MDFLCSRCKKHVELHENWMMSDSTSKNSVKDIGSIARDINLSVKDSGRSNLGGNSVRDLNSLIGVNIKDSGKSIMSGNSSGKETISGSSVRDLNSLIGGSSVNVKDSARSNMDGNISSRQMTSGSVRDFGENSSVRDYGTSYRDLGSVGNGGGSGAGSMEEMDGIVGMINYYSDDPDDLLFNCENINGTHYPLDCQLTIIRSSQERTQSNRLSNKNGKRQRISQITN